MIFQSVHRALFYFYIFNCLLVVIADNYGGQETRSLNSTLYGFLTNTVKTTDKFIILPLLELGLANRLRIIASMYSIARKSNRKLVLLWQPTSDCMADFSELFSNHNLDFSIYSLNYEAKYATKEISEAISYFREKNGISWSILSPRHFFVDIGEKYKYEDHTMITVWTLGIHAPEGMHCSDYLHFKSSFYKALKPSPRVADMIGSLSLADLSNGNRVVGLHIRAYHTKYDWPVVVPLLDSNVQRFDQVTPLDSYINIIQSILSNYPNTKFFIASNNIQAKEHLIKLYGTKIVTLKSNASLLEERSSSEGMIVAAAEFFLLGDPDYLFG
jgi:hypothetical protein